ncbi:T9SS type A sorting domain-containing protein [Fluviicola sp.]|jgi:hypothetical protein|uniref:T9SS type A sorting domain-containing protein n=1 Tax=Fluviicola sp. TaxID=1917219 RepID=UPI00261B80B9|nr:T9SS type A sorting domain-containing protein [Fluviicola sp.]
MKRKISCILLLFAASTAQAQTVSDDLTWVSGSPVSSAVSPNFDFCNGSQVNYEISSGNHQFTNVTSGGNPALINGIIIPANTLADASTGIPMNFRFSSEVCNLRIRFVDLDGISNESLTAVTPAYSSLAGPFFDPGSSMTAVDATIDNATGWVQWNGPVTNISFIYSRPGVGYGLSIDSITFDCCTRPCECRHDTKFNIIGTVDSDGNTFANVNVNSMGIPVRSICIDMPFYLSNVDDACLKCDPQNKERFGTILGAAPIAGTPGLLHDPHNLGYSRKICWNFLTPTVVNANVQIDLKFPGVLDLSCCKNVVSYCLDVNFTNEDCTACEYTICTKFPQTSEPLPGGESKAMQSNRPQYNDFAEKSGFQLSPNPTDGKVEVQILDEKLIGGELVITSTSGTTVLSTKISTKRELLNVSDFAKGTYVVSIENKGNTSSSLLIVK